MRRRLHHQSVFAVLAVPVTMLVAPASGQCTESTGATDCNANGIPDACEITGQITLRSGPMGPLDSQTPQSFDPAMAPVALDDVYVTCTAQANLAFWTERVDVWLNDTPIRSLYLFSQDCSPVVESLVIPMDTYMDAMATGSVSFRFVPSAAVNTQFCVESFIDATVDLTTMPALDENHNGVLDECEQAGGTLCEGLEPTIYVDEDGRVVGGPLDGQRYHGVLVGTPGDDVIMGTPGNDHIVGASGDDRICGNGGNDHIAGEPQGQANGHADAPGQSNPRARGRDKSKG